MDFLSWEGYDIPDQSLGPWRKKNGVEVKPTYIANHDEIQAKLLACGGSQGYDIITYYQGYRPLYTAGDPAAARRDEDPEPRELLPYFASDDKEFWVGRTACAPACPWTWGSIGITYDSGVVTTEPTSWTNLLEPKRKGKVALPRRPGRRLHARGARARQRPGGHAAGARSARSWTSCKQIIEQSKGVAPSFGDCATQLVSGDAVDRAGRAGRP